MGKCDNLIAMNYFIEPNFVCFPGTGFFKGLLLTYILIACVDIRKNGATVF